MDMVVAEYASASSPGEFWEHLAAILTDEVVILEAQAVGMDWPDLAEGLQRLVATRDVVVATATAQGWITPDQAAYVRSTPAREALAAARPWIEQAERQALEQAEADAHLVPGEPVAAPA